MSNSNDQAQRADGASMSRRTLVISLGVAATGIAGISSHSIASSELAVLRSAFASLTDASKVGQVYLRLVPHEGDLPQLTRLLFPSGVPSDVRNIRRTLVASRELDLRASRTLVLGGWLVALTEARWCALAYLLRNAP